MRLSGGDEGIRTLDTLLGYTPLAGERLRPLGHVSAAGHALKLLQWQGFQLGLAASFIRRRGRRRVIAPSSAN